MQVITSPHFRVLAAPSNHSQSQRCIKISTTFNTGRQCSISVMPCPHGPLSARPTNLSGDLRPGCGCCSTDTKTRMAAVLLSRLRSAFNSAFHSVNKSFFTLLSKKKCNTFRTPQCGLICRIADVTPIPPEAFYSRIFTQGNPHLAPDSPETI
jgi:hypothetical protein